MKPISLKELKEIHDSFNSMKISSEELKDFTNIVITAEKILYTDKDGQRWIRKRQGDTYGKPEEVHCCGGSGDCGDYCCEGDCCKTSKTGPKRSLQESLDQASRAIEESPDWLKSIYKQNEAIERARAERLKGK